MMAELLLAKFDVLAETPDAIQKLRALVLRWAEQGRLVAQDAADAPAELLLEQIARERATVARDMVITRARALPPIEDGELPFPAPPGWSWARMGELARAQAGFAFASSAFVQGGSGVPIIRIRDIASDRTQVNYVGEFRDEFLVEPGDYLVGMDGNFNVARWRGPKALLNQRVTRLQWYSSNLQQSFFTTALQHRLSDLQGTKAYTTVDHLSTKQIEQAVVPVPPLAEQKRIVEKVDELMVLCDRLEAQQQQREHTHAKLDQAALARFAEEPTAENLKYLLHRSFDVPPAILRDAIRSAAISGRFCGNASPWITRPLKEISTKIGSGATPSGGRESYVPSGVPLIRSMNVHFEGFDPTGLVFLTDTQAADLANATVQPHDVLLNITGASIGRVTTAPVSMSGARVNQHVTIIRPAAELLPAFLALFLASPSVQQMINDIEVGATRQALTKGMIEQFAIPVPPFAEQGRIVAKVNDLMILVERLEADLAAARVTGEKLMDAVVAELTAAG